MDTPYTSHFYRHYLDESRGSARKILPYVIDMFRPKSVVDVGCGVGTWLSVCIELGIADLLGVDGAYVDRSELLVKGENFYSHDLSQPLKLERTFDLAMSLEVAEHIPEKSADIFVESLTRLAPIVLFSAAPPFQGGDFHINEQWPEYWAEKFKRRGFLAYDFLRPLVWDDEAVAYYYAQNVFLFVHQDHATRFASLALHHPISTGISRIHPRKWLDAHDPRRQSLRMLLRAIPYSLSNALQVRVRRLLRANRPPNRGTTT